jgi:acetolactate synthase small subunit
MDFTLLLQRFAEQSPLIMGCGLAIWQLLKMYKEEKALLRIERQERNAEIKELIDTYNAEIKDIADKCSAELKEATDKHTAELKELNNYTRERDLETQEALSSTVVAVEAIHQLIGDKFRLLG